MGLRASYAGLRRCGESVESVDFKDFLLDLPAVYNRLYLVDGTRYWRRAEIEGVVTIFCRINDVQVVSTAGEQSLKGAPRRVRMPASERLPGTGRTAESPPTAAP
jgi:hypothetical protein